MYPYRTWTTLLTLLWMGGATVMACTGSVSSPRASVSIDSGTSGHVPDSPADESISSRESSTVPTATSGLRERAGPTAVAGSNQVGPTIARGQALFSKQCVICHGETGDGAGKFAYLMNPRPRNLQEGKFKLATTVNQVPTDEDLLRTISRGMPGSAMPPWGHLPRSDLQALVKYVRKIHTDATQARLERESAEGTWTKDEVAAELVGRTEPGPQLIVPPEPSFESIRWFNGRKIYLEACASCHGESGHPVAEAVKFDEEGYPVPPRSFVNGIFKGGSEGHQLYARILKGMRGTPMPASEGNYSDEEVWDLIHYVQSLAREGSQERAQLRQGVFTAPNIRGALPEGPLDSAWDQARPLYVGLTPLWWEEERIEGLVVQALHNGKELAMRLSWIDPSVDDLAVRQTEFRDAVAIQFSLSSDPPFYMGDADKNGGVNIWMWKADRQRNIKDGYQDIDAAFPERVADMYPEQDYRLKDMSVVEWPHGAITEHVAKYITAWGAGNLVANPNLKTPVECLVARGPGTLSGKPANAQLVEGQAVHERGVWYVQLQRSMGLPDDHGDERFFKSGDYLPVSFAIWNGRAGDRDGKKNISIWQKLVIE